MKGLPEDRAVQFARYIIEAGATVRETAKEFHISKSTVHKDIQERLPLLNYPLYREVRVPKLQPSASSATMATESAAEAISPEEAGRRP